MKLFNKIKQLTQKISKKAFMVTGSLIVAAGLTAGAAKADFFPSRPVYDYNKGSDSSNCADPNDPGYTNGRCGSLNGPVFDSFINTPSYGDERAFLDAVRTDQTAAGSYTDTVTDVTSGSKEVILRTYVHNNANQNDNATGKAIAHGTKVRILLPTADSNGMRARSYISADNASMVEDTVDFTAPENFHMEYIPGSATLVNSGTFKNGVKLSDSIVTDGALIGSNALDGNFYGCFDYASVVEIHVKIVPDTKPQVTFSKQVALPGGTWSHNVDAKPGDTVKWMVSFQNTGTQDLTNVNINDVLPPHLGVVPGSVKYIDAAQTTTQSNSQFFTTGGIDFNTWHPNGGFYVRFDTTALSDFDSCRVTLRNIANESTTQTGKGQDSADVTITKQNCTPPPTPIVSCDALSAPSYAIKEGESTVFTVNGTATNTSITGYTFTVNGQTVQDSAANTYTFTRGTAGTYTIAATVKTLIGSVTGPVCSKNITVSHEITPVYTCDALTFSKTNLLVGEKLTTSVNYTAAGGAAFKQATFNFGDSATFTTNNSANGVVSTDHTYAKKGNYAIAVKLDFTVNGATQSVEGGKCVGQVTVTEKPVTPPTVLPNTGAGDMIGLFAGVTTAGAAAHSIMTRRRASR